MFDYKIGRVEYCILCDQLVTLFNDVNKKKLKAALRVKAVKLIDAKDEAQKVANTSDSNITGRRERWTQNCP